MKLRGLILLLLICSISCEEGGVLFETDISNSYVSIVAPTQGSEIASNSIQFTWDTVEGATEYEIQVATPNFENAAQVVLSNRDTLTSAQLEIAVGNYEWRVRAFNSAYNTPYSNAKFKVTPVENFSDNVVILLDPQNNTISNSASQTFSWQAVPGATLYRFQLLNTENAIITEQTTSATTVENKLEDDNYTWQIRAENGLENTLYSSNSLFIDTVLPNVPVPTSPEDNSEFTNNEITFTWTREPINGSLEKDSLFVYEDELLTNLLFKKEVISPHIETLENNTYYWNLRSFDEAGNSSATSTTFSFMINK